MRDQRTFADFERAAGQAYSSGEGEKWSLQEWYDSRRYTPITQLSVGDLAIACRQEVFIEHLVPVAINTLENDPQAGALYDGELVVALKSIPAAYWSGHPDNSKMLQAIIKRSLPEFDEEVRIGAKELLLNLG